MNCVVVKCPICKGKGVVFDHAMGILTLGFAYIMQLGDASNRDICTRCGGTGYVKVKVKN